MSSYESSISQILPDLHLQPTTASCLVRNPDLHLESPGFESRLENTFCKSRNQEIILMESITIIYICFGQLSEYSGPLCTELGFNPRADYSGTLVDICHWSRLD